MLTFFRDLIRARRILRHEASFGTLYEYHGLALDLPSSLSVGVKNAILKGKYEQEEFKFLSKYLPKNASVLEIGGSLGVVSSLIRSKIDPDRKLVVVEANPALINICDANIRKQTEHDNYKVLNCAIGQDGVDQLHFVRGDNEHVGYVSPSHASGSVPIPSTSVEGIIQTHQLERAGLSLVCDVEGAEVWLLEQGAIDLDLFSFLCIELHPQFYETGIDQEQSLLTLIQNSGFELIEGLNSVYTFERKGA